MAKAILEAASEGGRDVTVGAMAKIDVTISKLLPRLGDRFAAMQARRQQADAPPQSAGRGLYEASGEGRMRGKGSE